MKKQIMVFPLYSRGPVNQLRPVRQITEGGLERIDQRSNHIGTS